MYVLYGFSTTRTKQPPQRDKERDETLTAEKHNNTTIGLAVIGGMSDDSDNAETKPSHERRRRNQKSYRMH